VLALPLFGFPEMSEKDGRDGASASRHYWSFEPGSRL